MSTTGTPFLPVDTNIDDSALQRLAATKGIGTLVKPQAAASPAKEGEGRPLRSPNQPRSSECHSAKPVNINFHTPDYLRTAMKIRAAEQGTCVRHVILQALREDGLRIEDADMEEDGRRVHSENA